MGIIIKTPLTETQRKDAETAEQYDLEFRRLQEAINSEKIERQVADTNLQNSLNSNVRTLTDNLNAEIATRQSANETLTNNLNAEINNRVTAINNAKSELTTALNNAKNAQEIINQSLTEQIQNATNSHTTEFTEMDSRIANAIQKHDNDLSNLRADLNGDIQVLTENLNTEIAARQSEDNNLQNEIDGFNNSISSESQARQSKDTDLQNQINSLSRSLATETTTRVNDVTTLNNRIDALREQIDNLPEAQPQQQDIALTAAQSSGFQQSGTLTYTGSSQSPAIRNYNSNVHVLSGETSKTTAGTYTLQIAPAEGYTWDDGTKTPKSVTWKINPKPIPIPYATTTEFSYDGAAKTLQVTNYDSAYMTQSGTVSESSAGDYSVTYTLKNKTNYIWEDNTTANIVIEWSIGSLKLTKPTLSFTSKTYTGDTFTPTIKNFDAATMTKTGTESSKDVGTFTITIKLKNPSQYQWKDDTTADVVLTWKITQKSVTRVTLTQSTYEYNGADISALLKNFDAESKWYTATGDLSAKNAGTYNVTIAFKAEHQGNVKWSTGSNTTGDLTFTWTITPIKLTETQSNFVQDIEIIYDGKSHSWREFFSFYNASYYDSRTAGSYVETVDGVSVEGSGSAKNAGDYCSVVHLKNNYTWYDGTTEAKVVYWTISPMTIPKPTFASTSFTYDGTEKTPVIYNYNSNYMTIEGTQSETTAGSYSFTVKIKGDTSYGSIPRYNAIYEDGTKTDITCSWKIDKAVLPKPTATSTYFTQDGTTHTLELINYDSSKMTQIGKISASAVGTYSAYFTLIDSVNYKFDGTTSIKVTINWEIGGTALPVPTIDSEIQPFLNGYPRPQWNIDFNNFNKELMSYTATPLDGSWAGNEGVNQYLSRIQVIAGALDLNLQNEVEFSATTHKQRVKVTFKLKDKTNYKWIDNTTADKEVITTLMPFVLTSGLDNLVQDITCTYDGTAKLWRDYYSAFHQAYIYYDKSCLSDDEPYTVTDAGTYSLPLKPASWCTWADGTFATRNFNFKVDKKIPNVSITDNLTGETYNFTAGDRLLVLEGVHDFSPKNASITFTITTDSPGNIGVVSENLNAFPLDSGERITDYIGTTQSSSTGTATVTLTAKKSAIVSNGYAMRLTFQIGSSTNYAGSTPLMSNLNIYTKLEDYTWEQIEAMAANDTLADKVDIGDTKSFTVAGDFGEIDFGTGTTMQAILIGINHNAAIEGNKRAHFAAVRYAHAHGANWWYLLSPLYQKGSGGHFDIVTADSVQPFTFQYAYENFYNNIVGGPKDFIKNCKKYISFIAVTHKIWLMSWYEWFGNSKNNSLPEGWVENTSYQAQYEYRLNGNKPYMSTWEGVDDAAFPVWTRTEDNYKFLCLYGTVYRENALDMCGVIPCFCV